MAIRLYEIHGWGEFSSSIDSRNPVRDGRIYDTMEQSDLAEFRFYEGDSETGAPGGLICNYCNSSVFKWYDIGVVPNLLELMEDAAAHYALAHRKSDGG